MIKLYSNYNKVLMEPTNEIRSIISELEKFYSNNSQIKESHGLGHAMSVYGHALKALESLEENNKKLDSETWNDILIAALCHDVDDQKYFPNNKNYDNARKIFSSLSEPLSDVRIENIIKMISWVSCTKNGNSVPDEVKSSGNYYLLIPRWADRLEAVGKIGVIRCYQFNQEHQHPLFSDDTPRPLTEDEMWKFVTVERFESYQTNGGSKDMISHYYDKLFHVARPPKDIVQNKYLEEKALESCKEMIEVCLRFGKTGKIDEEYIKSLENN